MLFRHLRNKSRCADIGNRLIIRDPPSGLRLGSKGYLLRKPVRICTAMYVQRVFSIV